MARRNFQEALNYYDENALRWMKAVVLGELAWVAVQEDRLADAERLAETGRAICKDLDYRIGLTAVLTALGDIALRRGNRREAWMSYRDAMQTAYQLHKPPETLHAMAGMAILFAEKSYNIEDARLAVFIQDHPATWHWTRERIKPLASAAESLLSGREATRRWGKDKTIDDVIDAMERPDD